MNTSFFNYPKQAVIGNYDDVRSAIIEFYDHNEDVISIYEYGSVSNPGVSDLDLIFVLKDEISSTESEFNLSSISAFAQDLVADGTVIKMPLNVFKNRPMPNEIAVGTHHGVVRSEARQRETHQ